MFTKPWTDDQLKANRRLIDYLFNLEDPVFYSEDWESEKRELASTGSVFDRAVHDYLLRKSMVMQLKGMKTH